MTNKDILNLNNFIGTFLKINPKDTVAAFRLNRRVLPSLANQIDVINNLIDDANADFCAKRPTGEMIREKGEFTYTAESYKALKNYINNSILPLEVSVDITKIEWDIFTDSEKAWFDIDDIETNKLMNYFVSNLPNPKV